MTLWRRLVVPLVAVALLLVASGSRAAPPRLPILGPVDDFTLVDQAGRPFPSATRLRGRPWIANFIFTRCTHACPIGTSKLARLERTTRGRQDGLHLVSLTIDPEHDTPRVLARYAAERGADTRRWSFLAGDTRGPRQAMSDRFAESLRARGEEPPLFHGTHLALVDGEMRLRGFYDAAAPGSVERLLADLDRL